MKKLFIVANWKANKTQAEAAEWMERVQSEQYSVSEIENKEIIICPSFQLLSLISDFLMESPANEKLLLRLGGQNLSGFGTGAYTGEVPAELLKEFCAYSIIGHSERRENFNETDEVIYRKLLQAKQHNITPILCASNPEQVRSMKAIMKNDSDKLKIEEMIIAYEPLFAIGSGKSDTPENANENAKQIKAEGVQYVLYGGSVNPDNIHTFTTTEFIDGVLVGGASLDPEKFIQIIKRA